MSPARQQSLPMSRNDASVQDTQSFGVELGCSQARFFFVGYFGA